MKLEGSHLIAGRLVEGEAMRLDVTDPCSGAAVSDFASASPGQIDEAVAAASAALPSWAATPGAARARVLRAGAQSMRLMADNLARMLAMENGKPLAEAKQELEASIDTIEWFADEARRVYGRVIPPRPGLEDSEVVRRPVGVVALFSPWNFPVLTAMRKIAPALAAGCTVVAKPAEECPGAVLASAVYLQNAGLPDGTLNMLFGNPADISGRLLADKRVAKASFTGSTAVGRHLSRLASENLTRLTMELGGHAPVIVAEDADPRAAARKTAAAKFRNAGQVCTSPSRVFVVGGGFDAFVDEIANAAEALEPGDWDNPTTTLGPLAHGRRIEEVQALVHDALSLGAKLITGGRTLNRPGFFHQATVLADVPSSARIMKEEPFGPVICVNRVPDLDAAITAANDNEFALAAYLHTYDAPTRRRVASEVRCGLLGVNTFSLSGPESPFGGIGSSGYGLEGGPEGLDAYLVTQYIAEGA